MREAHYFPWRTIATGTLVFFYLFSHRNTRYDTTCTRAEDSCDCRFAVISICWIGVLSWRGRSGLSDRTISGMAASVAP